ncbi:MAG: hypothetical protein CVU89_06175 [Firmicutes bacterium HGW-Firmicutes-14]|nr:MAG: hypothetical protein CVU89_06175 [Firmicutes bacterium HGW-Firmicutes-14]
MNDFSRFNQETYSNLSRVQRLRLRRVRKGRLALVTLCLLVLAGTFALGVYTYAGDLLGIGAERYFRSRTAAAGTEEAGAGSDETSKWLNIMLVGTDQRKNEPSRSDTLMVAMLNLEEKRVRVISIPRDTRVKIDGISYRTRINHAHSNGGIDLTRKTVEELLGIPIHNYIETNFEGFENIIDILGGVELEVEMRMYYPPEDINLRKGYRRLDGQDALSYVRFRSDGKGDLPRIERQHKFMKALADEVLQPGTILKLPDIMKELRNNVKTDLSARDVVVLAGEFRNVSSQNIGFCNLPGSPQYINGASYYVVDEEGLEVLLDEILNGKTESGSTEDQAIHAEEINADVQPERE